MDNIFGIKIKVGTEGADESKKKIVDLNAELKKAADTGFGKTMDAFNNHVKEFAGVGLPSAISNLGSFAAAFTNPIGAIVATAAALKTLATGMAFSYQKKIDEIADLSDKLGLTVNQTLFLKEAMDDAGLSIGTLQAAGDKLAKSMAKSGDESKGAGAAFAALGIATEDANGQLRGTEEVMADLVERYDRGSLSTSDLAAMQQVLGKNFRESITAFKTAQTAVEEHNQAMQNGIGISQAAIKASSDFETSQRGLRTTFTSIGSLMVELVLPKFTQLNNAFVKSYTEGGTVATIVNTIAQTFVGVGKVTSGMTDVFKGLIDTFRVIGQVGGQVFEGLWKIVTGNVTEGVGLLKHAFDGVGDEFTRIGRNQFNGLVKMGEGTLMTVEALVGMAEDRVSGFKKRVKEENNKPMSLKDILGGQGGKAIDGSNGNSGKVIDSDADALKAYNGEMHSMEDTLIKLRYEYEKFWGVLDKTASQMLECDIEEGKFNATIEIAGKKMSVTAAELEELKKKHAEYTLIKRAATSDEIKAMQAKAADIDFLKAESSAVRDLIKVEKERMRTSDEFRNVRAERVSAFAQANGKTATEAAIEAAKLKANEARTDLFNYMDDNAPKEVIDEARTRYNRLMTDQIVLGDKAKWEKELKEYTSTFEYGWNDAFKKYADNARNAAEAARGVFDSVTKGMENMLVKFVQTGKLSFKDFAKSVISDLAQIAAKAASSGIMQLIGQGIGAAFGVNLTGPAAGASTTMSLNGSFAAVAAKGMALENGVKKFAVGGVVDSPTLFPMANGTGLMGEAGPEAIMPLRRDAAGRLGISASTGGGGVQIGAININVQGGKTNDETADVINTQLIKTIQKIADGRIANARRVGGLLNN
jgi:lambda family phage tail tape measure protein